MDIEDVLMGGFLGMIGSLLISPIKKIFKGGDEDDELILDLSELKPEREAAQEA